MPSTIMADHHGAGLHARRQTHRHSATPDTALGGRDTATLASTPEPRPPAAASSIGLARPSARSSMVLGAFALFICILSFVGQTIIIRSVQESYVQPYFILWFSHSFW
ncbi:hypothetical protein H4R99_006893, partial [Coemansia sp. RSA 1722]